MVVALDNNIYNKDKAVSNEKLEQASNDEHMRISDVFLAVFKAQELLDRLTPTDRIIFLNFLINHYQIPLDDFGPNSVPSAKEGRKK